MKKSDADATDVYPSQPKPSSETPNDGKYGSSSTNETGTVTAPPAGTDQV